MNECEHGLWIGACKAVGIKRIKRSGWWWNEKGAGNTNDSTSLRTVARLHSWIGKRRASVGQTMQQARQRTILADHHIGPDHFAIKRTVRVVRAEFQGRFDTVWFTFGAEIEHKDTNACCLCHTLSNALHVKRAEAGLSKKSGIRQSPMINDHGRNKADEQHVVHGCFNTRLQFAHCNRPIRWSQTFWSVAQFDLDRVDANGQAGGTGARQSGASIAMKWNEWRLSAAKVKATIERISSVLVGRVGGHLICSGQWWFVGLAKWMQNKSPMVRGGRRGGGEQGAARAETLAHTHTHTFKQPKPFKVRPEYKTGRTICRCIYLSACHVLDLPRICWHSFWLRFEPFCAFFSIFSKLAFKSVIFFMWSSPTPCKNLSGESSSWFFSGDTLDVLYFL